MGRISFFSTLSVTTPATHILNMKAVIALLCLALACTVSASKADCSVDAASKCVTEIGAAWDSCQDWSGGAEILACMDQIIGATDCWDCVCTVQLPPLLPVDS